MSDPMVDAAAQIMQFSLNLYNQQRADKRAEAATYDEYKYQSMLNQEQNEYNTLMWNANNQYNTPESQLSRYMQIGINPGTAVQAITGNHYNAVAPQSSSSPGVSAQYGNVSAQTGAVLANQMQQIYQAQLLKAQAENLQEDTTAKQIDNESKPEFNKVNIERLQNESAQSLAEIEQIMANIDFTKAKINLTNAQSQGQDLDNFYKSSEHQQQLRLSEQQIMLLRHQIKEVDERIISMRDSSKISAYNARTDREAVYIKRAEYQLERTQLDGRLNILEKTGLKLDAETKKIYVDAYTSYWNGNLAEAKTKFQDFENKVREFNGVQYYSITDALNVVRSFIPFSSSTSH